MCSKGVRHKVNECTIADLLLLHRKEKYASEGYDFGVNSVSLNASCEASFASPQLMRAVSDVSRCGEDGYLGRSGPSLLTMAQS